MPEEEYLTLISGLHTHVHRHTHVHESAHTRTHTAFYIYIHSRFKVPIVIVLSVQLNYHLLQETSDPQVEWIAFFYMATDRVDCFLLYGHGLLPCLLGKPPHNVLCIYIPYVVQTPPSPSKTPSSPSSCLSRSLCPDKRHPSALQEYTVLLGLTVRRAAVCRA